MTETINLYDDDFKVRSKGKIDGDKGDWFAVTVDTKTYIYFKGPSFTLKELDYVIINFHKDKFKYYNTLYYRGTSDIFMTINMVDYGVVETFLKELKI